MARNNNLKLTKFIWMAYFLTVFIIAFLLIMKAGGPEAFGPLDYDRMVRMNDPFALSLYVLSILAFAGHRIAPKLFAGKGPNSALIGFIVQAAILESIALYGFILGQSTQDPQAAVPLIILSLIGLGRIFPSLQAGSETQDGAPIT